MINFIELKTKYLFLPKEKLIDKIKLTKEIKEWAEKIVNDNIIRKTIQSYKRIINKKVEYIHEAKLRVTCCFKCLFQEFIKDPINENYSTISYKTF